MSVRRAGLGVVLASATLLAACGSGPAADPGTAQIRMELSDAGCAPQPASVPAGPVTFTVVNNGTSKVTEGELQAASRIIGEKENVTPGLSSTFTLRLDPGTYLAYCPGAARDNSRFTVTGSAPAQTPAGAAALSTATTQYHQYVTAQVDALVAGTKVFTDAVRRGDLTAARAAFAPARYHYETIEPVASSFADLDPQIDARADDEPDPTRWTGFHRLEQALYQANTTAGLAPLADRLDADLASLRTLVAGVAFQPAELANGARELLNEVSTKKVTGEEDRYSHTDLSDFAANIEGAQQAFDLLSPALATRDPALDQQLRARFTGIVTALRPYQDPAGPDGWKTYDAVDDQARRVLADRVNALAEPLSQVSGTLV
ncbi:iron uptake system protein EfeO [Actinomycetospora endophytica]|uniref:Iron uptake system protein EfeO n=1 Tax=Actinomycetospora endophytica TaxID=2291215 RepID=A0ABS8PCQ9_9PSEU|nr:iron uptake system protein EfeO [Actinomycetospora endophytica]MCD2195778.1 iron uptake system protein EfeO [Actinomycetospora endophytica]